MRCRRPAPGRKFHRCRHPEPGQSDPGARDKDGIIAETLGGIFGLGCWAFAGQYFTTRVRGAWSALGPGEWAAKVLPGYILFLVATHGMPFDLSISPTMIWHKFKTGFEPEAHDEATGIPRVAFAPYPHQAGEKILQSAAYFLPVGVLFAGLPHRRWQDPKAPFAPIAAGFLVAAGLEAIQVIVLSCSAYATDVLFGTLCCVSGWWLMLSREKLPAWLPPVAFLGWSLALAIVHWAPFDFDADREGFVWVPFADYFQGNYLGAFNSIINKTIQFAPLGFIAIFACTRPQQKWALALGIAVLAGTLVVTGVEIGQTMLSTRPEWDGHSKLVIKPRPGSISDITLGVLGSLTGALVALPCRSMTKAAPPEPTRQQFLF